MKAILEARHSFIAVGVYQWLHSMIEESVFNHAKFAPKQYCIDNISYISSRDSTTEPIEADSNTENKKHIKDENKSFATPIQNKITNQNNFKDNRDEHVKDNRDDHVTEMSVFNNLLRQRIRSLSNNMHHKYSSLELNARESTLANLVEQWSPNPTSSHGLDCCSLEPIDTETGNKNYVKIRVSEDSEKKHSIENDYLQVADPSQYTESNEHFLSVHSTLSVCARQSVEWSNDYVNECPSPLFMQHFIAPTFQKNTSTKYTESNNSKDNFGKESTTSTITEENVLVDIPKKISFGQDTLYSLKESDEERETGSLNSKEKFRTINFL